MARPVVLLLRTAVFLVLEVPGLVDAIVRAAARVGVSEVLAIVTGLVLARAAATENTKMNENNFAVIRIVVVLLIIPYLPFV